MSKRFGFYEICPDTDTLEECRDPFGYTGEMFIARDSYGKESTLKRFKKELKLTDDEQLISLADFITIDDVKQMYRVNCCPGWMLADNAMKEPCFPCWVIYCCEVMDRLVDV